MYLYLTQELLAWLFLECCEEIDEYDVFILSND